MISQIKGIISLALIAVLFTLGILMNVLANIFFGIGVFFSKLKNTERVVKIEQRDFIDDLFDIKQTDNS